MVLRMLVLVEHRTTGPEVVAGVLAGDTVHRVLTQVAPGCGLGHGSAADVFQGELVEAQRRSDVKGDRSGVLADRGTETPGQEDVLGHQAEGEAGPRAGLFQGTVRFDDPADVGR